MTIKKAREIKASGTRVQVPRKDLAELATVSRDVAEREQAERNELEKRCLHLGKVVEESTAPIGVLRGQLKLVYLTMALIMALMAVIAPASTARAAIINVPTDYPTIQAAVNAASPGDTIVVAAGTYNETVNIDKSLTLEGAQAGVDARGRSGSESVINAPLTSSNPSATVVTTGATNIVINGFKIIGSRGAVTINAATVEFVNNIVQANASTYGTNRASLVYIADGPTSVTVRNNDISPTAVQSPGTNSLRIAVVGAASVLVDNNWLHNATHSPTGPRGAGLGVTACNSGTTINVTNNDMYDNGSHGMFTWYATTIFGTVTVTGNDIYNNVEVGVLVGSGVVGDVQIHNNNILNNGMEGVRNERGLPFVDATNNWWGEASGPKDTVGNNEVPPCSSNPADDINYDGLGDEVSEYVKYCGWVGMVVPIPTSTPTPPPASPDPPSKLAATAVSQTQIDLTWQDNSNNEDGFYIERKLGAGGNYNVIDTVGANVTTYSDSGLSGNTTYYYRVYAYNGIGGSYSNEDRATTFGAGGEPSGGGCFIATAAYGSYLDSHVETLRDFRDSYMLTNPVGSSLISIYYKLSPPIAHFIDDHPALKPVVRVGLLPAVGMSTVAVNTTLAEKMAIVGSLALVSLALVAWLRKRQTKA